MKLPFLGDSAFPPADGSPVDSPFEPGSPGFALDRPWPEKPSRDLATTATRDPHSQVPFAARAPPGPAPLNEAWPAQVPRLSQEPDLDPREKHSAKSHSEQIGFDKDEREVSMVKARQEQIERCNCKRSKCLKLYCECFSKGGVCKKECKCEDCHNTEECRDLRELIVQETMQKNSLAFRPKFKSHSKTESRIHTRGCTCKKTECIKSYCECFRAGSGCSRLCRCSSCKNQQVKLEDNEVPFYYEKILRKRKKPNYLYDIYFKKSQKSQDKSQSYSSEKNKSVD